MDDIYRLKKNVFGAKCKIDAAMNFMKAKENVKKYFSSTGRGYTQVARYFRISYWSDQIDYIYIDRDLNVKEMEEDDCTFEQFRCDILGLF